MWADDAIEIVDKKEIKDAIETVSNLSNEPNIHSRFAVVMDRETKAILYGKKENIKTKMASTTKIMTAIITIENVDLSTMVKISNKAAGTGGSRLKLKTGDSISMKDLLYGLMMRSGNDAAVAIAEHVSGSIPEFAKRMNEKAKEIGLKNTHFETPHGLDTEEHYTTAYELALLTDYALHNTTFKEIVGTKVYTITINGIARTIYNTNELLGNLEGVYGVKTGFTNGAGRCLVTAIKREKTDIICVVLGADTKKDRTKDSIALIQYIFENFKKIDLSKIMNEEFTKWKNKYEGKIKIEKGTKSNMNIVLEEYTIKDYIIKKNTEDKINLAINVNLNLKAPVQKRQRIGQIAILYENTTILQIDIQTAESVEKKHVRNYILDFIKQYPYYLKETVQ